MPNGRAGLAVGAPQITKTPERWPSVVEMIQRSIEQTFKRTARPVKPKEEDFESIEEFLDAEFEHIEALMDWKIDQRFKAERTLKQRTEDILDKALISRNPTDWRSLRQILGEWIEVGVRPIPLSIVEMGATTDTWLFDQVHNGLVAHREDGGASLFWSENSGILLWGGNCLPAII